MSVNFQIKKIRDPITTKSTSWEQTATKWQAVINGQKFTYWTGSAITTEPTYDDIMASLLLDQTCANQSYSDLCNEFGYNAEEKSSQRIYQSCLKNTEKLSLTGIDLNVEGTRLADY